MTTKRGRLPWLLPVTTATLTSGVGVAINLATDPKNGLVAWGAVVLLTLVIGAAGWLGETRMGYQAELLDGERRPIARGAIRDALKAEGVYRLGVEAESREMLSLVGLGGRKHAPYLPRDVDEALERRLEAAVAVGGVSLVVLSGPAKAGKSRTLLECVARAVPDACLLVPPDPDAFVGLARRADPPGNASVWVVWLDDIEPFVRVGDDGLNPDTLAGFGRWRRTVLVLATHGGKGSDLAGRDAERFADPISNLLRAHPPVTLAPWLSRSEKKRLENHPDYSAAASERIGREGIGEFMIAAQRLRERLDDRSSPEGVAITRAVVDWRRVGLTRGIPEAALRASYVFYLAGPHQEERFLDGLRWATQPLYSGVCLIHGRDLYDPYDYIVRYDAERERPIPTELWDAVIDRYADADELAWEVGITASEYGLADRAERALRSAAAAGQPDGAHNLAVLLKERGDDAGAEEATRRADELGHGDAAANLSALLLERGDLAGAEAAARRAASRGHLTGVSNLGAILRKRGDVAGAAAAFRAADDRGSALGSWNLGVLMQEQGDMTQAKAAFQRADQRGHPNAPVRLGSMLFDEGKVQDARAAFERADERGSASGALTIGLMLAYEGANVRAREAFQRALDRAKDENEPALVDEASKALRELRDRP